MCVYIYMNRYFIFLHSCFKGLNMSFFPALCLVSLNVFMFVEGTAAAKHFNPNKNIMCIFKQLGVCLLSAELGSEHD